ncbi:hypothetical protein N836_06730 [Leptolyngbya sp. Heron Island J]|uniref:hypothetical protein n=1 Tax=Leptolyngbya sp. Heron Island J TaxID=1385935 RepID=UPI0003B96B30|nr:hypothetical protein [Leptolyngbya sp. Heron Island J]ESA36600.1 hypothetical protein N836_06730 [Leptolyngbya sp. Heron Island J]
MEAAHDGGGATGLVWVTQAEPGSEGRFGGLGAWVTGSFSPRDFFNFKVFAKLQTLQ